ncbi:hypothetical protein TNCV_4800201 [Trichonephila clavipes]|nr:hypothetical protein TNCV_4800201 [Trichonephila clavipes]
MRIASHNILTFRCIKQSDSRSQSFNVISAVYNSRVSQSSEHIQDPLKFVFKIAKAREENLHIARAKRKLRIEEQKEKLRIEEREEKLRIEEREEKLRFEQLRLDEQKRKDEFEL